MNGMESRITIKGCLSTFINRNVKSLFSLSKYHSSSLNEYVKCHT